MNPYGAGRVVVTNGRVTDDGDFYTQNNQPVELRAFAVYFGGTVVKGQAPPRRLTKVDPRPFWLVTRLELNRIDLTRDLGAGDYFLRLWGAVASDPDWYEIGTGNPADNGATDVVIGTTFRVGPAPPDPRELLRRGVATLEASNAYRAGYTNVVAGTKDCRRALDALGSGS